MQKTVELIPMGKPIRLGPGGGGGGVGIFGLPIFGG